MPKPKTSKKGPADIVIITGLSGSGMTSATNAFEDLGYFCVDRDSKPGHPVFNRTVALKDTWAKVEKKIEKKSGA